MRPLPDPAKPLVRWWWLSGPFRESDIQSQLTWLAAMGFGGVELAWIYPSWAESPGERPSWLSPQWQRLIAFTQHSAAALGLRCDFTFGSSWPFGSATLDPADAAQTFTGPSPQRLHSTWEYASAGPGLVLNHLSAASLRRYASPLLAALPISPASSLFCDSLEIETDRLWSPHLWAAFEQRFGYSLEPYTESLHRRRHIRYDYRKLIAETMQREFFNAFTALCHEAETTSRVQCHGAPVDLLAAYASVDIPESEALLFPPQFSRIAASAAAWAGHPIVSAEAFTCIYGFPGWDDDVEQLWKREELGDLQLLAAALFANGVNRMVWHGMPFQSPSNPAEFYASVHVGPDSPFAARLPAFNGWLTDVSRHLQAGITPASVGVYLPWEDALMAHRIPRAQRSPGANYRWEMRHASLPPELDGYQAVWISPAFLREARVEAARVVSRQLSLDALYLDCRWLDADTLREFARLAQAGARLIWKRPTRQPGHQPAAPYANLQKSVTSRAVTELPNPPLLTGDHLPWFWSRRVDRDLVLFFAHPRARDIRYPMPHRFSASASATHRSLHLHWSGRDVLLDLPFAPNQSILVKVSSRGQIESLPL